MSSLRPMSGSTEYLQVWSLAKNAMCTESLDTTSSSLGEGLQFHDYRWCQLCRVWVSKCSILQRDNLTPFKFGRTSRHPTIPGSMPVIQPGIEGWKQYARTTIHTEIQINSKMTNQLRYWIVKGIVLRTYLSRFGFRSRNERRLAC